MALVGEKSPTLEWFGFHFLSGTYTSINFPYDKLLAVDPDGFPIRKKWCSARRWLITCSYRNCPL
jgi:hypothetical protein